jgi:hypothetical protein
VSDLYPVRPVTMSTQVPAEPDRVFDYLADTRNDPEWCLNVSEVRLVEGKGVDVGSRFVFHQRVETQGRELVSDVDVEVVELGERHIRWRVEDRFQVRDVLLRVEPDEGGSKVTQITTAAFKRKPGLARWLYPLLARRTLKDQFRRLAEQFAP